jgi:hypothetical protein
MRSSIFWFAALAALLVAGCEKKPEKPARQETAFEKRVKEKSRHTVLGPDGNQIVVVTPQRHPLYVIVDTPPRNDYERTLSNLLSRAMNPDALQTFCGRWYPDSGRQVADAYLEWRDKNGPVVKELIDRSTEVWTELAGEDVEYVRLVHPHLRNQLLQAITAEFDRSPAEKFAKICADYPREFGSARWDLEKNFRKELAQLRRQPLKPVAAN